MALRTRRAEAETSNQALELPQRAACPQAYLDTFSFQCPTLYLSSGYEVFGQLEGFPTGNTRICSPR
jgi:hypothetical protein